MLRHTDAHLAHPHDVHLVLIVRLDPDRGKDKRAFRVDVLGRAHVGRRQRVAAIRLMALGEHRESMHALVVNDGNEDAVVGRMRAAMVWRVVKKRVAAPQHRMVLGHRARHHFRSAQHMDRQTVRRRQQLVARGQNDAGKVAGDRQNAGAAGPVQGVRHLAGDSFEPGGQHGKLGAAHGIRPQVSHGRLLGRNLNDEASARILPCE